MEPGDILRAMTRLSALCPEKIEEAFGERGFVATGELSTTLFLAERLGKPLLLEGPPGVGKTEIGKLWAEIHQAELVRLQCYEGLDEAKALYEWSYGKQMLYAQLLREKTAQEASRWGTGDSALEAYLSHADVAVEANDVVGLARGVRELVRHL